MKIKITQPGWEGFTGYFGPVEFKDGLSTYDVSKSEAQLVAALVATETEEGTDPSVAQQIIDMQGVPAPVETVVSVEDTQKQDIQRYTAEELAEIADKQGIKGLRAIGDQLGVKGNSIAELISKILAIAGKQPEAAAPAQEVVEQPAAAE